MPRSVHRLVPVAVAALTCTALAAGCGGEATGDGADASTTLKVLYRAESHNGVRVFDTVRSQLAAVGIRAEGLPMSDQGYARVLRDPERAEAGDWDIAIAARANDGADTTADFLGPLVGGAAAFPPTGSNFGLYENPDTTAAVAEARAGGDSPAAAAAWARADRQVMTDAAVYPIATPQQASYAASSIGDRVYVPAFQNYDPTRVTKCVGDRRGTTCVKPGSAENRTLHLVGAGDVDVMDPNLSYYSIGYLGLRLWSRQLFAFSNDPGKPAPDLAVAAPSPQPVTLADGSTGTAFRVQLRPQARWGTTPARPVTGPDVLRGVKRTCNPVLPFGGLDRYRDLIEGFDAFCDGFEALGPDASVEDVATAVDAEVPGLQADAGSVTFTFTRAGMTTADAVGLLTSPAFAPAPQEVLADLPGRLQVPNMVASGPYRVQSYEPGRSIVLTPNPAWVAASDPVRERHFDQVVVDQTHPNQDQALKLLTDNSPRADLAWDSFVPASVVPRLVKADDPNLTFGATYALDPYLVFNTSAASELGDVAVRRSLSTALDRTALVDAVGGTLLNSPLTHLLPPGTLGSQPYADPYPYDPERAAAVLAAQLR